MDKSSREKSKKIINENDELKTEICLDTEIFDKFKQEIDNKNEILANKYEIFDDSSDYQIQEIDDIEETSDDKSNFDNQNLKDSKKDILDNFFKRSHVYNPGDIIDQKYKILNVIGKGGMGIVYKVEHLLLRKRTILALKTINAEYSKNKNFQDRFLREVSIALQLAHEHILPIRDFGETREKIFYFTMDFSPGVSLKKIIEEEIVFPQERALAITKQILSALSQAHKRDIVHRDIKPANIIVEKRFGQDHALVLDFGLAIQPSHHSQVLSNELIGSPYYMSPEQVKGETLDHRSDIYSVGLILYEMLAGKVPFGDRTNPLAILMARTMDSVQSPRDFNTDISQEVEKLIIKATAMDIKERFQSARNFIEAIEQNQKVGKWAMKGGNKGCTFYTNIEITQLKPLNSINIKGIPDCIITSNQMAYVVADKKSIWCLDKDKIFWEVKDCGSINLVPSWHSNHLFFGNKQGIFYCLKPENSKNFKPMRHWELRCNHPFTLSPIATNSRVCFACETGKLYCYSFSGDNIWQKPLPGIKFSTVSKENLYIIYKHYLCCLRLDNGEELWKVPIEISPIKQMCSTSSKIYIAAANKLISFDTKTGNQLWQWGYGHEKVSSIAIAQDRICIVTSNSDNRGILTFLTDKYQSFDILERKQFSSNTTSPLMFSNHRICIIELSPDPYIRIFDDKLVQQKEFQLNQEKIPACSPAICGSHLVIPYQNGTIEFFQVL